ncbi:MAG: hypothetical protein OXC82_04145 [Rhodobacteraceae bacterium]|nr:hypothetical protein [Paracoccaceae bacterium]MCY4249613.1 hypothetical protein [Paracoccaceae bacterium]
MAVNGRISGSKVYGRPGINMRVVKNRWEAQGCLYQDRYAPCLD